MSDESSVQAAVKAFAAAQNSLVAQIDTLSKTSNENFEALRNSNHKINNSINNISTRIELLNQAFEQHRADVNANITRMDTDIKDTRITLSAELKEVRSTVSSELRALEEKQATINASMHASIGDIKPTVNTTKAIYSITLKVIVPLLIMGAFAGWAVTNMTKG